mgnify:CR=1 FL=1
MSVTEDSTEAGPRTPRVGIVMGSDSDWPTMKAAAEACEEFGVACGYPANEDDIETRMRQGFSVFVMGWGEGGFRTVEKGRRLAGR